uniref:Uncharacterized protein n=1 Tax=Syphacia muris TaxID=451379 RepID=A0A0N5ACH2_9BILA
MKILLLSNTDKVIIATLNFIGMIIEPVRLYLGYYGNLSEKVSALSGFWIISLILQLPISIFLGFSFHTLTLPLERCVYTLHIGFLLIEVKFRILQKLFIIYGFVMIRSIAS